MKKMINWRVPLALLAATLLLGACEPSVRLTASWADPQAQAPAFSRILVMALGKDMEKRKLGEGAVRDELRGYGYEASTSIDALGPGFASREDTATMKKMLTEKGYDGIITIRVLDVHEYDRWVPGDNYYGPIGYYQSFYGYYSRVWAYNPGLRATDVEVLLESNLYDVLRSRLLWSGQSKAFTRNPTPKMAARYARNIVDDLIDRHLLHK